MRYYGHLIDPETFDISLTNPNVYQIFENKWDWEQRYIHPDYAENFNIEKKPSQVIFFCRKSYVIKYISLYLSLF